MGALSFNPERFVKSVKYQPLRGADHDAVAVARGILLQAMADVLTPQKKSLQDWRLWERDALDWFESDDEYVGSFQWVCDVLTIKPEALRRKMKEARRWEHKRRRKFVRSVSCHVHYTGLSAQGPL